MHRSRAPLALILTTLIFAAAVTPALAATPTDLKKHQQAAEDARKRAAAAEAAAKKLANEVESLDAEIDRIQAQAQALEPKIRAASKRTAAIRSDVESLTATVARTQAELAETEAQYDRQQQLMADRVEASYRQGEWFYLTVVLGSGDISDLIQRTELVSRVIESNNSAAGELEVTAQSLDRAKVKLERSLDAVQQKQQEAAQVEAELRSMHSQREAAARQRATIQDRKEDLVVENKKNAKRLRALADQEEAESARIAAELSGNGSGIFNGTMSWPVPASHRVTSNFGWRVHPILKTRRLHTGVDIGAPSGSAIVAAGKGTVVSAAYRGGYGNTIIIDHGNGVKTLYAHQLSGGMRVHAGQKVSKGQRIGTVGSTGFSTGPHLHFEVRVNGTPKNPFGYQ